MDACCKGKIIEHGTGLSGNIPRSIPVFPLWMAPLPNTEIVLTLSSCAQSQGKQPVVSCQLLAFRLGL
eukprot:1013694-Pelagomonas_calceolata.AAC.3